jgi:quinol monooxygenase YgiN
MNLLIVKLKIKPGTAEDFVVAARQLVAASRAEEGCLSYELWKGEDELSFAMVERYTDAESAAFHRKTDHYRTLGRKLGEYLEGRPEAIALHDLY